MSKRYQEGRDYLTFHDWLAYNGLTFTLENWRTWKLYETYGYLGSSRIARMRRGKYVLIPEPWRGKVTHRPTIRKRASKRTHKARLQEKALNKRIVPTVDEFYE